MSLLSLSQELKRQANQSGQLVLNETTIHNSNLTPPLNLDQTIHDALDITSEETLVLFINPNDIPEPTPEETTLVITGISSFLNINNVTVSVEFIVNEIGEVNFTMLSLLENWTFSTSFHLLMGFPFDNLSFNTPTFIFSTYSVASWAWNQDVISLEPGLNFASYLQLQDALAPVVSLLSQVSPTTPLNDSFVFSGQIDIQEGKRLNSPYPYLNLTASISDDLFNLFFLNVGKPSIKLSLSEIQDEEDELDYVPSLVLGLDLIVSNGILLTAEAAILKDSHILVLSVTETNQGNPLTLENIFELMAGQSFDGFVPSELQASLSEIAFKGFAASLNLSQNIAITSAHARLGSVGGWNIFDGFRIDSFDFTWSILDPGNSNTMMGVFESQFEFFPDLFQGNFIVEITTELVVTGRFQGSVSFNDLLNTLSQGNLIIPDGFASLLFSDFYLALDARQRNYNLEASAELALNLLGNEELALKHIRFGTNIMTSPDGAGKLYSGFIQGVLDLAGIEIHVSANHPVSGQGWLLQGNTSYFGSGINLTTIADSLFRPFNITLPPSIPDISLINLAISFDTQTKDFMFICEGSLLIEDTPLFVTITIDLRHTGQSGADNQASFTSNFGGRIRFGYLEFDLLFSEDNTSSDFIAVYRKQEDSPINVKYLIQTVSSTVANYIPASLEIDLKDVLFAYRQDETASQFVFGLEIDTGFNLSNLPLVGEIIAEDQTIGVDDLQIVVASAAITQAMVAGFNGLLPDGVTPLPDRMLDEGINIAAMINFGGSMELLNLPVRGGTAEPPAPTMPMPTPTPSAIPVATADNAKWYTLQKSFGPVHFQRVGVQYQNSALLFLLDASLSAAGLTLTLDGLGFGGSLNPFTPRFDLKGLGLDYRNGPLEIGGAFLRQQVTDGSETYDEYDGAAVIRTEALTLSAVGSYARLNGQPSLFIYAVLDYPLGGPSFFFVTGLAAGFGYNRSLNVPDVGRVADFALVREAVSVSTGTTPSSLADTLNNLRNDVPIDLGQNFLAVGIKFTSFKLVDSFVLVTAAFGNRFELNILGLSTLVVPTPLPGATVTPLAEVQMALKASFIPDEGFLGVSAQLTDASYILSRACHLTGGFAFYSWFSGENAGDFVQTLGGYHPDFQVPAHYPRVPRLGFNWRVNSELSLKGEAYYALTPAALMAGGLLQGAWHSGRLMACFNIGADFLIAWKPYHYDARANADLTVHYTFSVFGIRKRISVDVGANLHMYGPEFSGNAHIRLSVVSFDIRFGDRSRTPQPIDWNTFRASFLPSDNEDVVNLVVADGLVQELTDESEELTGWIVSPKQFTLTTNSVIPAQTFTHGTEMIPGPEVGIGPMAVSADDFASTLHITVTTSDGQEVTTLAYEPVFKDAPAGLWGEQLLPDLNGTALIAGALAGFTIGPKDGPTAGTTMPVDRNQLQFSTDLAPSYDLTPLAPFVADTMLDESARRDAIRNELVNDTTITARTNLLAALGITEAVALSDDTADVFVIAPQISA